MKFTRTNFYVAECSMSILLLLLLSNSTLKAESSYSTSNTAVYLDNPQMAVPGNFLPPFDYLNNIPNNGLDLNFDGIIDIKPSCSCRSLSPISNGTPADNGIFDDQIIIATGVSGQTWRLQQPGGVLNPVTLQYLLPGTIIPEVGNTGIYVLHFAHREEAGYFAYADAPVAYPNQTFGPVTNTCFYPDPEIINLDNFYCDNEPNVVMFGEATSAFDGNIFPLMPASESWSIVRTSDNATFFTQIFSPAQLGGGYFKARYTFDGGSRPDTTANKTGCAVTVEKSVYIQGSNQALSCNNSINITLSSQTCQVNVIPQLLLSTTPPVLDFYTVEVLTQNGLSLGNVIPAQYVGQTLLGVVTEQCSGLYCTTNILVKDLTPPVLNAPPDITVPCYGATDPAATGTATYSDCTNVTLTYTDQWQQNQCGNPRARIFRTWKAVDASGNMRTKLQTISIARGNQSQLIFPADVIYTCEEYQDDPTIADAAAGKAGIPNLVDQPLCSMIYTYADDTLYICGDPQTSFAILRTWYVIDVCGSTFFNTDGQGNDNFQIIRIIDNIPPAIVADPIILSATESGQFNGLGYCTSLGFIPPAQVTDRCNATTVKIFTPLGEAEYINGIDGSDGAYIPAPGLPLGVHEITYQATDNCGNSSSLSVDLTVEDHLPPIMICDISLNVSLNSQGYGSIFPPDIDEGSRDECCMDSILIKLVEEPDSMFRNRIDFYCTNATVEIVLRAIDCSGNYNECNAFATVEDRQRPYVISNVSNASVPCTADIASYYNPDFNAPVFGDNCNYSVSFSTQENFNECGIGTLTRTWTATDNPGNLPRVVNQTITITPQHDYRMVVPGDLDLECENLAFTDFTFEENYCDSIEAFVTQQVITGPDIPGCYRIIRNHQVINYCEYDGVSAPLVLPRRDGPDFGLEVGDSYLLHSDGNLIYWVGLANEIDIGPSVGFYTYQQIIDVFDENPPTISFDTLAPVCVSTNECTGQINYAFELSDDCIGEFTVFNSLVLYNNDIVTDVFGTLNDLGEGRYTISGYYPQGSHALQISAFDNCGNFAQFLLPFTVQDCTPPQIACRQDVTFQLPDNNGLVLHPQDLLLQSSEDCGPLVLSFDLSGAIDDLWMTCDSVGLRQATVWATNLAGQQINCTAHFAITAPMPLCLDLWNISGEIKTESSQGINQCIVTLTGPMAGVDTSDINGFYLFADMPQGNGYKVEPSKNTDHNNGVSTLDLIFITRHILGTQLLASPYKVIAADANRSGTISTADVIVIRRLILNMDTVYANNTSWRFVPAAYTFLDPVMPLAENFPENFIIESLVSDTTVDFVGIKIGDINGSANPGNLLTLDERNTPEVALLKGQDVFLKKGQTYLVSLVMQKPVNGCQWAIRWDKNRLSWLGFPETVGEPMSQYYGVDEKEGLLRLSWDQVAQATTPHFEFTFRAESDGRLSEALSLEPQSLRSEAYLLQPDSEPSVMDIALVWEETENEGKETPSQVYLWPNPFTEKATLYFNLPADAWVNLEVYDVNGKVLERRQSSGKAGANTWEIEGKKLQTSGVLWCRLQSPYFSVVKKAFFLDK